MNCDELKIKIPIKYNNRIPTYDLKCFKNKNILKKIKKIFNNENILFDENWQITDIPVIVKEYIIADLWEYTPYETLKQVLNIQNNVNLNIYSDENIEINKILDDSKETFLLYWYDIKHKTNNTLLNLDVRTLKAYKKVNPAFYGLLMQREIIIPKIINIAIKNKEIKF
jgi:hypothetical protein